MWNSKMSNQHMEEETMKKKGYRSDRCLDKFTDDKIFEKILKVELFRLYL